MRNRLSFILALSAILSFLVYFNFFLKPSKKNPKPKGEHESDWVREWAEMRHKSIQPVDWRAIEHQNNLNNIQLKHQRRGARTKGTETFADGLIEGYWEEKGSDNIAGNVKAVDYLPETDELFIISDGGSVWKKKLSAGDWSLVNHNYRFERNKLEVLQTPDGGVRIITVFGKDIYYSDNNGIDFNKADFPYPGDWTGNRIQALIAIQDPSKGVYVLASVFKQGNYQTAVYRSIDFGSSYQEIYNFPQLVELTFCNPYNTNDLYILDNKTTLGSIKTFTLTEGNVSLTNTYSGINNSGDLLPTATKTTNDYTVYIVISGRYIYRSINRGQTWQATGELQSFWDNIDSSPKDPELLFYGAIDLHKSTNGGVSWRPISNWIMYYGDEENKVHADIMNIRHFQRSNGTYFAIINTHGGSYISEDDLETTKNISMKGLRTSQIYGLVTDPENPERIYIGTQDQGVQWTKDGTAKGIVDFYQPVSGDFIRPVVTKSHVWAQYPGDFVYYFDEPISKLLHSNAWPLPGNGTGFAPMANVGNKQLNHIFTAGDLNQGNGSYLVRWAVEETASYKKHEHQYDFDFRADSGGAISAIGTVSIDTNRIYVSTDNGKFYYSRDAGKAWAKSTTNTPSLTSNNSCILASQINKDVVWVSGSGYLNVPIQKSTDGGVTFTPMSDGLPATLVSRIAANTAEDILFASTDAGPYVYVAATNKWYSLLTDDSPLQEYTDVEYIPSLSTARFATYGRGIWEFKLAKANAPRISASGPVNVCTGQTVTLSPTLSGAIQWFKDDVAFTNSQTITVNQSGNYKYKITNGVNEEFSEVVQVTVHPIPASPVLTMDGSAEFCQGETAAIMSNSTSLTKWYKNGSVDTQYMDNYYAAWDSGDYYAVKIENGCPSLPSNIITTVVTLLPQFPFISGASQLCIGNEITLTVDVPNDKQWYRDGIEIENATASTLTVNTAGNYTVRSYTECGSYTSAIKTVAEAQKPPTPVINPLGSTTICEGSSVSLSGSSGGTLHQWYRNGILISPETNAATYVATTEGSYQLKTAMMEGCFSDASEAIVVLVNPAPETPSITVVGEELFSSSSLGNQWYRDNELIAGEIEQKYSPVVSGMYSVKRREGECWSAMSSPVNMVITAIAESNNEHSVNIFPNPFKDGFTISANSSKPIDVTVYSSSGIEVGKFSVSEAQFESKRWERGMYMLVFRDKRSGMVEDIVKVRKD